MKQILLAALLLSATVASAQMAVNATEFARLVAEGKGKTLDVRRPGELTKSGIVSGAQHLDFTSPEFQQGLGTLDPKQPLYIYCHSGGRAKLTAEQLQQKGFARVIYFDGMLSELIAAKVPFVPWTGPSK